MTICRRSWCCRTIAVWPRMARRTGTPPSCPRSTRARSFIPAPRRRSPISFRTSAGDFITPAGERDGIATARRAQPRARRHSRRATSGSRRASAATSSPRKCSSPRPRRSISAKNPPHIAAELYGIDDDAQDVAEGDQRRGGDGLSSAANASPRGGCWSAACGSCRSGAATTTASRAATGIRTRTCERDHGPLARGMARGAVGAHPGSETARPARRHDHPLDHRIRPHAQHAGRQRARPQSVRLHQLALRRRDQRRRRRPAKATSGATSRSTAPAPPRSTTSTRRSCTCSASTTPS